MAVSTNDALGLNGVNLMRLMATKHLLRPIRPRCTGEKPNSMVARMESGRYSVRSAREAIATGGRRKIQIYELKRKKRTIFDETIILTVEYDKINVIKIEKGYCILLLILSIEGLVSRKGHIGI